MLFTVCPARTHPVSTGGARFVLQQDNWNDFGFRTLYQLYDTHDVQPSLIGNVKILKLGQKDYDPVQISVGQVSDLGPDFCSLGQGLDYYERLASLPLDELGLGSLGPERAVALAALEEAHEVLGNSALRAAYARALGSPAPLRQA